MRFGGAKLLAPLSVSFGDVEVGTPLGVAACRHLVAALPETIAVVRADDPDLARLLAGAGARVELCERAAEGMGASLACGVTASRDADGWIVALADMPWIAPATIESIASSLRSGADIAAPLYAGARGHPVGFGRRHYAALASLSGDEGARTIIAAHGQSLSLVRTGDAGVVRDVDTPADLG